MPWRQVPRQPDGPNVAAAAEPWRAGPAGRRARRDDGVERDLGAPEAAGSVLQWTDLPPGDYLLQASGFGPGLERFFVPGLSGASDDGDGLVRAAGFAAAVVVDGLLVSAGADPLRLPRIEARDANGDSFGRFLQTVLE